MTRISHSRNRAPLDVGHPVWGSRAGWFGWLGTLALLLAAPSAVGADGEVISREYPLKAAYLYNFANYVEWPAASFPTAESPLIIGVLGPNPFGAALDELASRKTVRGRPIVIRHFDSARGLEGCHILFMSSATSAAEQAAAIEATRNHPVLLVTEKNGLIGQGTVVNFLLDQNKLRFEVDNGAAERRSLKISSKLLSLAKITASSQAARQ